MRLVDLLHAHDDLGFIAMEEELIDVSWVTGGLVVGWATTSEYPLLYVFVLLCH
jgi:hypothetical protein